MVMRLFLALILVSSDETTEDGELDFLMEDVAESQVDALQVTISLCFLHYAEEVGVDACLVFEFGYELAYIFLS